MIKCSIWNKAPFWQVLISPRSPFPFIPGVTLSQIICWPQQNTDEPTFGQLYHSRSLQPEMWDIFWWWVRSDWSRQQNRWNLERAGIQAHCSRNVTEQSLPLSTWTVTVHWIRNLNVTSWAPNLNKTFERQKPFLVCAELSGQREGRNFAHEISLQMHAGDDAHWVHGKAEMTLRIEN